VFLISQQRLVRCIRQNALNVAGASADLASNFQNTVTPACAIGGQCRAAWRHRCAGGLIGCQTVERLEQSYEAQPPFKSCLAQAENSLAILSVRFLAPVESVR
jgi:hypothetical protein